MKKALLLVSVCVSLIIFLSATVWEGAAAVALNSELPENGLFIATNSFPPNTVLEITNLDNGKSVRVVASTGISNPGLLALLSRDAAFAIDLPARTTSRVRITQTEDPAGLARSSEMLSFSGDPDYDPAAFVALNGINPMLNQGSAFIDIGTTSNSRIENGNVILDLEGEPSPLIRSEDIIPASRPYLSENNDTLALPPVDYTDLALVPAETRPPEGSLEPDPAFFIPEIVPAVSSSSADQSDYIDPLLIIPAVGETPLEEQSFSSQSPLEFPMPNLSELLLPNEPVLPFEAGYDIPFEETMPANEMNSLSPFPAPMINALETGMYYIQIAAFSKEETVRSEISKLDSALPLAIMNAGNEEKPVYRILIGPVNLGESGALLRRFKTNYSDAFVWQGK